jgi:hypothetical protein
MRLALAAHSPLPRGAKKAAAMRARLNARKNKFASSRIIYAALSLFPPPLFVRFPERNQVFSSPQS